VDRYVADTHALFWYLTASPKLGANARRAFDEALAGRAEIFIPTIVLAELYWLNQKLGRPLVIADELRRLRSAGQFSFVPFMPDDVLDLDADAAVPEMHDRMIAGVARRMGVPCLTRDASIVASGIVPIVW